MARARAKLEGRSRTLQMGKLRGSGAPSRVAEFGEAGKPVTHARAGGTRPSEEG